LAEHPIDAWRAVYETNVVAPVGLLQRLLPLLRAAGGTVVDISSDAAVEAYPGWSGYGSAKAALDQLTAVLAVEEPRLHVYAVDPGDMRTELHQRAFPGEDISDRPLPADVVPDLLHLLDVAPPSGRYRARDRQRVESGVPA
jgi:NAD(P)-dependent dehydrogenase (short-subunit alcohol dehydrogenase family)